MSAGSRFARRRCIALAWGALTSALLGVAIAAEEDSWQTTRSAWNQPAPPFRVIDNVYYVGTHELGVWLITSPKGHVLLDGALAESVPQIEAHIRQLGFRVEDVRWLINSHAHFDHSGGLAQLRRDTGAQLVASKGDRESLEHGTYLGSETNSHLSAPPVPVDRTLVDGQVVAVGPVRLTAHLTPGHTRGCTTWTLPVMEAGVPHTVIFYCSTSVALNRLAPTEQYPGIVQDYRRSFERLRRLQADVFLANHESFFDLWPKRARQHEGQPNPFIDPTELPRFVAASEDAFEQELAQQRAASRDPS
jgi:metallo-beta-lactamase class B